MQRVRVIDSHTEGEPTRVVVGGAPTLAGATMAQKAQALATSGAWFRRAVVCEPRGSDILVGALLLPPERPQSVAGVIFFNNVDVLGMCGHGTMGVVRTLAHLAQLQPGPVQLDTPVGPVLATLEEHRTATPSVAVRNVRSYVQQLDVPLALPGGKQVHVDIAWGGNGFALCHDHGLNVEVGNVPALEQLAWQVRRAVEAAGLGMLEGRPVDHVELLAEPRHAANHGRSYVLCPGGAYDRSPCGTGTSAALACLAARGHLQPGERWRQESLIGSVFEAWYDPSPEGGVLPTVSGRAWITGECDLILESDDPYRHGISP